MARVLLIDDDEDFRNMLQTTLSRAGYDVETASDGKVALRLYRARPSDLVITDIVMPECEGLETIQELRRLNPDVSIIAISGGGRIGPTDYLLAAKRFGAKRALAKPFSQKEVLDTVAEVLAGSPDGQRRPVIPDRSPRAVPR